MTKIKLLWADDEIDLLKPQLFFLEKKGYEVLQVTNGYDALEVLDEENDIECVFLDESMPGITGLETLEKIREKNKTVPIVMITKNEAEDLMEQAIGSQINDYLIKPVNPNQILLSLKRIIDNKRLVSEKTASAYQQEFRNIAMDINSGLNLEEWDNLNKRIIDWELRLDSSDNESMKGILEMQKKEANKSFSKFIDSNYEDWIRDQDGPTMSHNLFRNYLFPNLSEDKPNIVILFDNLRYDQWKIIEPIVNEQFRVLDEKTFYSILPTATQYSRNAIFAGMLPKDIQKHFPDKWLNDNEKGGKNQHEGFFLEKQIQRIVKKNIKSEYIKVRNINDARLLQDNIHNYLKNDLTVIVYNFIDMLSHARTEMEVLKELAADERGYRSLTKSWFINSPIWSALQVIAEKEISLFITTDHGTIRVNQPSKVIADRETSTNLRYKVGKNLRFKNGDVYEAKDPSAIGLPMPNLSSRFIFTKEDYFFLYPNNYTYYNNMYSDTFQHGGISLEEIICPFVKLESK
ncbi:MAG: PglZ domain-containing protein [Saprospiraceae bacterium]|nr:PglZ domain-containing protein [Bacteroidia bacterium]NNE16345.1 PglZ domain-containing protein [Saprospiraceae bacterium]NNL91035.1 PglZ domain-containing protein [Saprospiraceae bacterium]